MFFLRFTGLVLLGSSLLSAGCGKSNDLPPQKTALLTAHNWRLTASTQTIVTAGATTTTRDAYATLSSCSKDNFNKYEADMTYVQNEGLDKCIINVPQTNGGTWNFDSNETVLVLKPSTSNRLNYQITRLTATTLELVNTTSYPATSNDPAMTYIDDYTYTAF